MRAHMRTASSQSSTQLGMGRARHGITCWWWWWAAPIRQVRQAKVQHSSNANCRAVQHCEVRSRALMGLPGDWNDESYLHRFDVG